MEAEGTAELVHTVTSGRKQAQRTAVESALEARGLDEKT
jgi:hypothetical protein